MYSDKVTSKVPKDGRFYTIEYVPGWAPLVEWAVDAMELYAPEAKLTQVKEKFGTLRIYTDGHESMELSVIIDSVEHISSQMCVDCGKKADMVETQGWYYPQCPECQSITP